MVNVKSENSSKLAPKIYIKKSFSWHILRIYKEETTCTFIVLLDLQTLAESSLVWEGGLYSFYVILHHLGSLLQREQSLLLTLN